MTSRARGVAEGRAASAIIIVYAVEMDAGAVLLVWWSDLVRRYTAREARNLLLGEVGRGITAANFRAVFRIRRKTSGPVSDPGKQSLT